MPPSTRVSDPCLISHSALMSLHYWLIFTVVLYLFFSETAWVCHPCHLWSINACYVFCWHLKWNEWIFVTTGVFKCCASQCMPPFLWLFCPVSMKAEKQCTLGNFHTWKFLYPFVCLWHDWSSFVCSHNDQIIHQYLYS